MQHRVTFNGYCAFPFEVIQYQQQQTQCSLSVLFNTCRYKAIPFEEMKFKTHVFSLKLFDLLSMERNFIECFVWVQIFYVKWLYMQFVFSEEVRKYGLHFESAESIEI